jgi:hypothetical protein
MNQSVTVPCKLILVSQLGRLMYRIGDKDEDDDYLWWNMDTKGFLFRLIGLYSLILGVIYATVLSYTYTHAAPQILLEFIVIATVSWLVIGGLLSFKKHSEVMTMTLLTTQLILEFLSGFTIGMFFLSGSVVLIISLIGYDFINSGE